MAQVAERVRKIVERPVRIKFDSGRFVIDGSDVHESLQSPGIADSSVKRELEAVLREHGITDGTVYVNSEERPDGPYRFVRLRVFLRLILRLMFVRRLSFRNQL